jgi:hypothetical protein
VVAENDDDPRSMEMVSRRWYSDVPSWKTTLTMSPPSRVGLGADEKSKDFWTPRT